MRRRRTPRRITNSSSVRKKSLTLVCQPSTSSTKKTLQHLWLDLNKLLGVAGAADVADVAAADAASGLADAVLEAVVAVVAVVVVVVVVAVVAAAAAGDVAAG
jgi:hypothetical protein